MAVTYTPASFTKNFSWQKSYNRLHTAIANGFSASLVPVTRNDWRNRSKIGDSNRELIPMNFFLYSKRGTKDDFIMVDRLVELAVNDRYDEQFARLSLFGFHLANSGNWRHSQWSDGRVAGWANLFIRKLAWRDGKWTDGAFLESTLVSFLETHIEGEKVTKRKVLTNYRYMLNSAGVLVDDQIQPLDLRARWFLDAVQLFWDRKLFDGLFPATANLRTLEDAFFSHEIHKLLGCTEIQGRAFVAAAFREYSHGRMANRFKQLRDLEDSLVAVA
jgi:hypothetical protein